MNRPRALSLPALLILLAASILFGSCSSGPPGPTAEAENAYANDEERDRMPEDGAQALEWRLEGNRRFDEGDIDPSLPEASRIHLGVEANVRQSVKRLLEIAEREARPDEERVLVVGAVYELDTGNVRVLDD